MQLKALDSDWRIICQLTTFEAVILTFFRCGRGSHSIHHKVMCVFTDILHILLAIVVIFIDLTGLWLMPSRAGGLCLMVLSEGWSLVC